MEVREAVIYTRVSRVHQGRDYSVDDQEAECRAECGRRGWPVREVFCDKDIGASRFSGKERPAWDDLKAAIRPGDIVVMWEASRSTRDLAEYVTLRTLCAELGVPMSYGGKLLDMAEAEDRFIGGLDALLAEREAEVIRARVMRGKRSAAAAGRPYGPTPWGLRRADTIQATWEIDPVEAPRLRGAMDRALRGDSLWSILMWLRASGYAPATVTNLRLALCNPALAGRRVYQRRAGSMETTKAQWPALFTEDEQQQILDRATKLAEPRGKEPVHLLSFIAVCGVCGGPLRHQLRKQRNYATYVCRQAGHVSRGATIVDGVTLAKLVEGFGTEKPQADDSDAQSAREEIAAIEIQLLEYEEQAIKGDLTAARFSRIEKGLLARIADLKPRTLRTVPSPFEYMKITTEEFFAANMLDRRAMVRARLNVVVMPVPPGRQAMPEDIVITPK